MSRLIVMLILFGSGRAAAQDWQLVWSDEFDVPGKPDSSKWGYDVGPDTSDVFGNQELQYYTTEIENVRVEDGVLVVEAREEDDGRYTSARLVTRGKAAWKYGRFEAAMKLPEGQGLWPAFWMLPINSPHGGWPSGGEIDIMETAGHEPDRVHGTLHYGGEWLGHRYTGTFYDLAPGTHDSDFHIFAIEWEPKSIRWYVDGQLYQTQVRWTSSGAPYPAPFDTPFYLILNIAVGGIWPGYPDETTTFPQRMEIEYVRVYQDPSAYPSITLEAPGDGAVFDPGATIVLAADATDEETIEKLEFLQKGGVLGSFAAPPYELTVEDVVEGCYSLSARAFDNAGYQNETTPIDVTVGSGCPDGSRWPFLMSPISIPGKVEAEYFDFGGPNLAYNDFTVANDGNGIRQDEGVDLRLSRDEGRGYDITGIMAREWVTYTVDVETEGRYRVVARVASQTGGAIRMSVDGEDLLGTVSIDPTGGDVTYGNIILGEVDLQAGVRTLRLDMGRAGFSLNRLVFVPMNPTAVETERVGDAPALAVGPNPALGRAKVDVRLAQADEIQIEVVDVLGRPVKVLSEGRLQSGEHSFWINVGELATGLYFILLNTQDHTIVKQLAVIR